MSRSKRKPYITQQNTDTPGVGKQAKRRANKAIRNLDDTIDVASGKQYRKYSNSWDIRDWSFYEPIDKKAGRK